MLAVSVGGKLMGVAGMLIMVPLTSVCYTLLREQTASRLQEKEIDSDKLREHPPEVRGRLSEGNKKKKRIRKSKKQTPPQEET